MNILTAQEALEKTQENVRGRNVFLLGQHEVQVWFKEFENQARTAIEHRQTQIKKLLDQQKFLGPHINYKDAQEIETLMWRVLREHGYKVARSGQRNMIVISWENPYDTNPD